MAITIATHGPRMMPSVLPGPAMRREVNLAAGAGIPRGAYVPDVTHKGSTIDSLASAMGVSRELVVQGFGAEAQRQRTMPGSPMIDPQDPQRLSDADAVQKRLAAAAGTGPAPTGLLVDAAA